jgi:hypothetical protein
VRLLIACILGTSTAGELVGTKILPFLRCCRWYYHFTPVDQHEDQLADMSLDCASRTQRMQLSSRHRFLGR